MKMSRRQLRRLIESVINEDAKPPKDFMGTPGEIKPRNAKKIAKALNNAMFGKANLDSLISYIAPVLPVEIGGSIGTNEELIERIFKLMHKNHHKAWARVAAVVSEEYERIFGTDLKDDLLSELTAEDLNRLELAVRGFKEWVNDDRSY
ncbi:MAG TPA: hypothetical protein EYQ00_11000 [Dehalococcoidia bacterium]|jgi:hypothetical protein|nr:hypothetical protein [Dehalococcoidia bacterium]